MKTTDNQNEIFIVVDRNDKIIDYRTRRDCHNDKSLIHRSVQVVLFDELGRVLLQKRSMSKDLYPGFFTVSASGHVEKGQTYKNCAKRELKEEIGLDVPLKYIAKFLVETDYETEYTSLFTGKAQGKTKTSKNEVDFVKFFEPKDIKQMTNITPMAKRSLEELGVL